MLGVAGVGGGPVSVLREVKVAGREIGVDRGGERKRLVLTFEPLFAPPARVDDCLCGWRGASPDVSATEGEGSRGTPVADRARWMAAADGVSGMPDVDTFGGRCGLRS